MIATRFASAAVIASFLAAGFPVIVSADETAARSVPSVDFRAAVERAAAPLTVRHSGTSPAIRKSSSAVNARQSAAGGGGGGKGTVIWSLVGTAASLATTYFVIKEVRKQTDLATKAQ